MDVPLVLELMLVPKEEHARGLVRHRLLLLNGSQRLLLNEVVELKLRLLAVCESVGVGGEAVDGKDLRERAVEEPEADTAEVGGVCHRLSKILKIDRLLVPMLTLRGFQALLYMT